MLNKVQLAYAAGIVDGEGHVSLYKNKSDNCKRGYRHRSLAVVTNTDLRLMKLFQSWFGGHVAVMKQNAPHARKTCYQWRLNSLDEQYNFYKLVEPYLFIKREQAQIVLDFLENGGRGYSGNGVTDEEFSRREGLVNRIARLNKRGAEPQRLSEETEGTELSEAIVHRTENRNS